MGKKAQRSGGSSCCFWVQHPPRREIGCNLTEELHAELYKAVWVEFIATMLFIFIAVGTIVFGCHSTDVTSTVATLTNGTAAPAGEGGAVAEPEDCFLNNSRVLTIAFAFGMSIFVLVYAAASFSGGHLNPAVTLAFFLTKKVSFLRGVLYVAAQIAGATVGAALVRAVDPAGFSAAGGGSNRLLVGIAPVGGWLMETILTCCLVLIVFAATDHARAESTAHLPVLAPAAIGFTVFICHLAAVAIDGCSINPARSIGTSIVAGAWRHIWIFIIGPISGAIIAALVYELTLRPSLHLVHDSHPHALDTHEGPKVHEPIVRLPRFAGVQGLSKAKQLLIQEHVTVHVLDSNSPQALPYLQPQLQHSQAPSQPGQPSQYVLT